MPIDTRLWNLVQENKGAVIAGLLQQYDPSYSSDDQSTPQRVSGATTGSSDGS
jgi:hypothetical protein